jgi:3-oxoacyl-[acyl-carrier protein] reductase
MDLGLKDATAVVVGGGRRMGFATARCLAQDGARVAVIGRTKDVLEQAAKDLTECGSPDAFGLVADTTDAGQVQHVFDELSERWDGELNALVNAVGPGTRGTFEDLTDEQWREAFDDGVMGMVH